MELLRVGRMRSPLLFCGDVYGQESRNRVPQEDRKAVVALLTNSVPLLAWKHFRGRPTWVCVTPLFLKC